MNFTYTDLTVTQIGLESSIDKHIIIVIIIARTIIMIQWPNSVIIGNDKILTDIARIRFRYNKYVCLGLVEGSPES